MPLSLDLLHFSLEELQVAVQLSYLFLLLLGSLLLLLGGLLGHHHLHAHRVLLDAQPRHLLEYVRVLGVL